MIEIKNIKCAYDGKIAVEAENLFFEEGKIKTNIVDLVEVNTNHLQIYCAIY